MSYFNDILIEASNRFPPKWEEVPSVIEETMRRGLKERGISKEKKDRWRYALKVGLAKIKVDTNLANRQKYTRFRTSLAIKQNKFNKKELKEIEKAYVKR